MTAEEKYSVLKKIISEAGSMAVAFSGGVDSTFLLKTAHDILGEKCIAVTARSCSFPQREQKQAAGFCRSEGIRHIICESEELEIEGFSHNPPDRCYLCKKELFGKLLAIADENGAACVAEGSNMDDLGDFRPGLYAVKELGIRSPLREAGLYKEEIRALSHMLKLPVWDKPSSACLASRFVYGEEITAEKLKMVEQAEDLLLGLGFKQVRVRVHANIARIELMPGEFEKIMKPQIRTDVTEKLKEYGFAYVTLDLCGYRTGSMNEVLKGMRNL